MRFSWALWSVLVLVGCPTEAPDPPLEPTYENVENIVRQSCAFTVSCHGGIGRGKAHLNFSQLLDDGVPIVTELNGVPACEYDRMPRIDPGHPENSWLWIKVSGAHTGARLDFTPAADWDPMVATLPDGGLRSSTCPLTDHSVLSFGEIMPMGGQMSPNRLKAIREWIEMGAPGPDGYDAGVSDAGAPDLGMDGGGGDGGLIDAAVNDSALTDATAAESVADAAPVDALVDAPAADAAMTDAFVVDGGVADAAASDATMDGP